MHCFSCIWDIWICVFIFIKLIFFIIFILISFWTQVLFRYSGQFRFDPFIIECSSFSWIIPVVKSTLSDMIIILCGRFTWYNVFLPLIFNIWTSFHLKKIYTRQCTPGFFFNLVWQYAFYIVCLSNLYVIHYWYCWTKICHLARCFLYHLSYFFCLFRIEYSKNNFIYLHY